MGAFVLCETCRRHVRRTDASCPFCRSAVDAPRAVADGGPRLSRAGRLLRRLLVGASVAPAVGCGATGPEPVEPIEPVATATARARPTPPMTSAVPSDSAAPPEPPMRRIAIYGSVEIRILQRIPFAHGSAVVDAASGPTLDEVAALMKERKDLFLVIEARAEASEGSVDALAAKRAVAIAAYLQKAGVAPARIRERPVGDTRPVADPSTPEGRALNRAATFGLELENGAPPSS